MSRERLVMKTVCVATEVVDRAKSGDGAAFAELVQTHQAEVRSFLYRMTAHRQDAEDLSQEVWLRVHRKLPAFEGRASFRTWLFRVATNLARDEHRARQRWPVNAQDLAKELAESGPETAAEFRRVERDTAHTRYEIREHIDFCLTCIMKTLPLEQQLAVMLSEMYGFTNTEAADVLEVSLGVLKHQLHDARTTLDRVFEQRCALINKRGVCHADLVANKLNDLYSDWCRTHKQKRIQTYAFKCMASVNGQALIPELRGRQRSHIIATTKDLLTTGVNVPCVRNIVFFRYVQSPILFHQMVGRGTRIDAGTNKLMFRVFDYTAATELFGADFITPPSATKPPDGPDPPQPPPPPPDNPIKAKGIQIRVKDAGQFNLMGVDGKLARVTPEQYRKRLVEELIALVPSLADFRERWLDPAQRKDLIEQLGAQGLIPDKLRDAAHLDEYDLFDVMAHLAYGVEPLTRTERAARFEDAGPDWFSILPPPATKVLRAVVRQFEKAGTDALETPELWQVAEVKRAKGLAALKPAGNAAELLRKTKETLFAI